MSRIIGRSFFIGFRVMGCGGYCLRGMDMMFSGLVFYFSVMFRIIIVMKLSKVVCVVMLVLLLCCVLGISFLIMMKIIVFVVKFRV